MDDDWDTPKAPESAALSDAGGASDDGAVGADDASDFDAASAVDSEWDVDDGPPQYLGAPLDQMLRRSNVPQTIAVVPDHLRVTRDVISHFEYARLLGLRAQQIADGSPIYGDVDSTHDTAIALAEAELRSGKCPLKLRRILRSGDGECVAEMWDPNAMTIKTPPIHQHV